MDRDYEDVGCQSFVKVGEQGNEEFMELPQEKDGTMLLSTVLAQYPNAIGLKYKSSSGGWRGIRAENNVLDPPFGGWGETVYFITQSDAQKRKSSSCDESNGRAVKSKKLSGLLEDLIVLGIPYTTTADEVEQYFTDNCGKLAFHELKYERDTKKSRGFAFIRFQDEEGAKEALNGNHEILGRKLKIRLSKKKESSPVKLFVGRLAVGTTQEDVNEYFSEFGDLSDIFVPNPFRGFGFITYAEQEDATKVLRMSHVLKGARLNISAAEPKEDKHESRQQQENHGSTNHGSSNHGPTNHGPTNHGPTNHGPTNNGSTNYTWNSNPGNNQGNNWNPPQQQNTGYDPRGTQESPSAEKDISSELKDILLTLINSQKQKKLSAV